MKSFFRTLLFYIKAQFFFRKVDIILSSSVVFNRGDNGENHFFKPFLNFCRINNLTFVVFEEGDLSGSFAKFHHSSHAIQMWPIVLFEMILRKLFFLIPLRNNYSKKSVEDIINKLSAKLFLRNLESKNIVTLIDHKAALWRSRFPLGNIFDYQHGVIYDGHIGYLKDGSPSKIKTSLKIKLLTHSRLVQEILINQDHSQFYSKENIKSIGYLAPVQSIKPTLQQSIKIIFTLQNASEGGAYDLEERLYKKKVERFLANNSKFFADSNISITLRHHPRANIREQEKFLTHYSFVKNSIADNLLEDLHTHNLHMTFNSTAACEAAFFGIPTVFLEIESPQHDDLPELSADDLFINQLKYPLSNYMIHDSESFQALLKEKASEIINPDPLFRKKLIAWHKLLHNDFSEQELRNALEI
jgi:hypothetical protein